MTVTSTNRKQQFTTNGVTTEFTFTFAITDTSQVYAYTVLDGVETEYTDFTVIESDDVEGGTLTTNSALSGVDLLIYRDVALTQQVDYESGGRFPADSHEQALDKLTLQNQDQEEELERSVKVDISQNEVYTIGLLEDGKLLTLNGSTIESSNDDEIQDIINELLKTAIASSTRSDAIAFQDGVFDYTITGFNASISSYYIYHPDGAFNTQILIPDLDYTYDSEDTETITLSSSWSGGYLIARVLDPEGSGTYMPPGQYTYSDLTSRTGLQEGTKVTVSDLGYGEFVISDSSISLTGDIELDNGQVAVMQSDSEGAFDVRWFGASGEDEDAEQDIYFNLAADRGEEEAIGGSNRVAIINVPNGTWLLNSAVTTPATWHLSPGALVYGLGKVQPSGEYDTSYLTGSVIKYDGIARGRTIRYGDPAFTVQKYTGKAYSAEVTGNAKAAGGITGTTHATINNGQGAGFIAGTFVAVSDNDVIDTRVWGTYVEAYVTADSMPESGAYCTEATIFNDKAEPVKQSPNSILDGGTGSTWNQFLTTGGLVYDQDKVPRQVSGNTTGAIGIRGKEGSKYDRGIIVKSDSIETGEIVSAPANYSYAWYDVKTNGATEVKCSEIRGSLATDSGGAIELRLYDENEGDLAQYYRCTLSSFTPQNLTASCGSDTQEWQNVYTVNSPIVSSDETLKELRDVNGNLSIAEKSAAIAIAKLPKIFKWISEVEKNGDSAYYHCSPMAQRIWNAMELEGLDPNLYGFISDGGSNGTYKIQPQEILWMVCAAQQEQIEDIQTRLLALEG